MNKFNYCIGHYWTPEKTNIGCYTRFSEVHFGTQEGALAFLDYVKSQNPDREWKIFKVVECES